MKIVYVGKHGQINSNDDEGAIHFALEKLGHEVVCIQESRTGNISEQFQGDFLLCHHWHDLFALRQVRIPKVFWCFDLIDWPGGGPRHSQRRHWMREITEVCDLGFLTDGDWVAKDTTCKLHWLPQGADERPQIGTVLYRPKSEVEDVGIERVYTTDILFVGGVGYGRDKFVQEMRERYGEGFKHVLKGCHGVALANEVNQAKIVIAPDSPVTDRYWSNRLYNMLRLGAFLLHPYCEGAYEQYGNLVEWYKDREQMHRLIKWALTLDPAARNRGATLARVCTEANHTYSHRCTKLVRIVQGELGK